MDPSATPVGAQEFAVKDVQGDPSLKQCMLDTTAAGMQYFGPIKNICTHLCALHAYSDDIGRQVVAHHFCSHVSKDMHQCIIYDSNKPDARLIGIEYLISEALFLGLDPEEKKYWHSHQFEVSSGMLVAPGLPERAEREFVTEVQGMYGKIVHTWQIDKHPLLPLGPPQLMTSLTADWQVDQKLMLEKDVVTNMSSEERKRSRQDLPYTRKAKGADAWQESHEAAQFVPETRPIKLPGTAPAH